MCVIVCFVCTEPREEMLSVLFHHFSTSRQTDRGSHWNWSCFLDRQVDSKLQLAILLSLSPQAHCLAQLFTWALGFELRLSELHRKHPYLPSYYLPSPHHNSLTDYVRKGQDNVTGQNPMQLCSIGNYQTCHDTFPCKNPTVPDTFWQGNSSTLSELPFTKPVTSF